MLRPIGAVAVMIVVVSLLVAACGDDPNPAEPVFLAEAHAGIANAVALVAEGDTTLAAESVAALARESDQGLLDVAYWLCDVPDDEVKVKVEADYLIHLRSRDGNMDAYREEDVNVLQMEALFVKIKADETNLCDAAP